jgi:creatinine amidohydrolase/Fe(II)-dependent formamide hydrolase-like protein
MDQAVADDDVAGKYMSSDSTSPSVRFNDFWGRWTTVGVHGDPTVATAEKGKIIWEAVLSAMLELVDEFRAWPIGERRDQHQQPVQSQIQW